MTRQSFPDRQEIESALERVCSGELSPAEATQMLLQLDSGGEPNSADISPGESLRSLLDRLGTPPIDIVESWCQQLGILAAIHEREAGEPLPAIQLHEWAIDTRARLIWKHRRFTSDDDLPATAPSQASLEQVDRFRVTLLAKRTLPVADDPPDSPPLRPVGGAADRKQRGCRRGRDSGNGKKATRVIAVAAILVGSAIAIGDHAWHPTADSTSSDNHPRVPVESTAPDRPVAIGPASTNRLLTPGLGDHRHGSEMVRQPTAEPTAASETDADRWQTLDSIVESETVAANRSALDARSLSLEMLLPTASGFLPKNDDQRASETESGDLAVTAVRPDDQPNRDDQREVNPTDDPSELDDGDVPAELPQRTRVSTVTAIELPPMDDPAMSAKLWQTSTTAITLQFPFEVALAMNSNDARWKITDTRKNVLVATINSEHDATVLNWSETATESAAAGALSHGRLIDGQGRLIYLRPMIEADPWPIRLDQSDSRPTWDLRQPIPPRVARLSLEYELPEGVELGWIEPIEPTEIRRTRAVAVLTPQDRETVSLGMRLDVRGGRQLSCRVRFAARLDPAMPWQKVSSSALDQFADQLTEQAAAVSRESTRLSAAHPTADSQGRRAIAVQQEAAKTQAESLRLASERVAELQSLIALLEVNALLKFRVWVQWPQGEQTILQMGEE